MSSQIKIRARLDGDTLDLRTLSTHPMETGLRKDSAGKLVPLHFIHTVTVSLNDKPVVQAETSQSLSTNPNLGFRLKGIKAGDRIAVTWEDNQGQTSSETTVVGA